MKLEEEGRVEFQDRRVDMIFLVKDCEARIKIHSSSRERNWLHVWRGTGHCDTVAAHFGSVRDRARCKRCGVGGVA